MKTTVSKYDFHQAFTDMGRQDNFSYEGLEALFNYLEYYEESTGEEVELDVVGLCCEYNEWENVQKFTEAYGGHFRDRWWDIIAAAIDPLHEDREAMLDYIRDYTTVIDVNGEAFITQAF